MRTCAPASMRAGIHTHRCAGADHLERKLRLGSVLTLRGNCLGITRSLDPARTSLEQVFQACRSTYVPSRRSTCAPAILHPCAPAHLYICAPAHLHTCLMRLWRADAQSRNFVLIHLKHHRIYRDRISPSLRNLTFAAMKQHSIKRMSAGTHVFTAACVPVCLCACIKGVS